MIVTSAILESVIAAGFVLAGFFEDSAAAHPLAAYTLAFVATRAVKPTA